MDPKNLKIIKDKLLAEEKQLQDRLSWFTVQDKDNPDDFHARFPNYGDKEDENAAEVAAYSDRLSMEHTVETDLRDIRKALASIEKGTYGICQYCKNPIEEQRLLIRPTSSSCVQCKKKLKGEQA
ncbi:MAG: TraR/DksA C4-type zinc finger protein [Patescibacteria group bacterium]|nr:TraR/DksA C4-type zinc finger protein [Patescibacteria group bacterium]